MTENELNKAVSRMTILVDTREQPTERAADRLTAFGGYKKTKLDFGDYSAYTELDDGRIISLVGEVGIERKMSIDELALCFGKERARFEREFERMQNSNARLYLLVEDFSFEQVRFHRYRSKIAPKALEGSLFAWMARYHIQLIGCHWTFTGEYIKQILSKELKEKIRKMEEEQCLQTDL